MLVSTLRYEIQYTHMHERAHVYTTVVNLRYRNVNESIRLTYTLS
jgi:hypothetical protein